jgi:transcriptional regulator with XRE-family HTH domain
VEFSEKLCALMDERGISVSALARRVYCDRSLICRYRSGKQRPSARLAQRCDEVLGAGGALIALAEKPPPGRRSVLAGGLLVGALLSVSPETLERLAWAQRHPPQVDMAAVDLLADLLAGQRSADDAFGSAVMLAPALAQLTAVEGFVKQARGSVRRALINVAQQWAQFAAYQHRQIGDMTGDRDRLAQALEWATEIGDQTMTATVLINRGETALLAGEVGTVIGLAQTAQHDTAAAVGTRAHGADLEARGHALAGDAAAAERCLGRAAELATRLTGTRALGSSRWEARHDRHPWLYWMSPTDMQCKRGVSLGFLAGDPRYHDRAVVELETGYAALPDEQRMTAWGAKYPAHLAVVHARAGDVEQACAAALLAAGVTRRTGPSLAQRLAEQVSADLGARYPGDPRVQELADALA